MLRTFDFELVAADLAFRPLPRPGCDNFIVYRLRLIDISAVAVSFFIPVRDNDY